MTEPVAVAQQRISDDFDASLKEIAASKDCRYDLVTRLFAWAGDATAEITALRALLVHKDAEIAALKADAESWRKSQARYLAEIEVKP